MWVSLFAAVDVTISQGSFQDFTMTYMGDLENNVPAPRGMLVLLRKLALS